MRIGLLSDIHCTAGNQDDCLDTLETVISGLSDADYIVLLGDMITNIDTGADAELMAAVADATRVTDTPVRAVPGNHDTINQSAEETVAPFGHRPYGHEVVRDQDLLFLDSSAPWKPGSRGEISDDQLVFLDETLPGIDDALIFVHHPVHYQDISDNPWFGEHPERAFCGNKKEVNEIFEEHGGVRSTFSGHIHAGAHTVYNGIDHVSVPDFTRGCPAEESVVSGRHMIVDVGEESIDIVVRTPDEKIGEYAL